MYLFPKISRELLQIEHTLLPYIIENVGNSVLLRIRSNLIDFFIDMFKNKHHVWIFQKTGSTRTSLVNIYFIFSFYLQKISMCFQSQDQNSGSFWHSRYSHSSFIPSDTNSYRTLLYVQINFESNNKWFHFLQISNNRVMFRVSASISKVLRTPKFWSRSDFWPQHELNSRWWTYLLH